MLRSDAEKLLDTEADDAAVERLLDQIDGILDDVLSRPNPLEQKIADGFDAVRDADDRNERRFTIAAGVMCMLIFCGTALSNSPAETLDAINQVEASGNSHAPRSDNFEAIGPLQIHSGCFRDSGVSGKWEDCEDLAFSRRVAMAYFQRYCPSALKSGDSETMARVWNGGPLGARHRSTLTYWAQVKEYLK